VGFTLVSFHAHPDDEALLTAGTLARAAAEGHRVVLVVATAGEAGLVSAAFLGDAPLAVRRRAELRRSAAALGCARVEVLGYGDSGFGGTPGASAARADSPPAFATVEVEEAAERLAVLLREERADVLTSYDAHGGYGHPDHVQVHRVGLRAAELAGTPVVLEATVDRDVLRRALRLAARLYRFPPEFDASSFDTAYTAHVELTHRVDVRRYARQKRAAMAAHASQASADSGDRTLAAFLRIPLPLYRRVFGREWFVERGRAPGGRLLDDVFASLHGRAT
jgi:LmbE family N-acetylglucosaminyl deacetylase